MLPKHPFIDPEDKAALLSRIDDGIDVLEAAKRSKIHIKSARRIVTRSHDIEIYHDTYDLPPPSLHERVTIKTRPRRNYIMSEINRN